MVRVGTLSLSCFVLGLARPAIETPIACRFKERFGDALLFGPDLFREPALARDYLFPRPAAFAD